jgi:hypothetical protein
MYYRLQVEALSELFVAWDDILAGTENKVTKLERDREERQPTSSQTTLRIDTQTFAPYNFTFRTYSNQRAVHKNILLSRSMS